MPNTQPWEYQEEEIRHSTTGAIGAKDPQGNIVYGPLAKQYLTPIESVPKITIPEIEAPATSPGMALIDKTPESWLMQQQQQMQERIEKQQEELSTLQEERKGLIGQAKDFFSTVPKMETSVRDLQQKFGVTKTLELQEKSLVDAMALRSQAILLSEQRDGAIAALGQQGTLTPFITRQQAVIAENYDRRINTLAAQEATQVAMFQAQQGQIQQARGLVSDIVDAMTYDTNLELTKFQMFLDLNRDEISMLDTSIQRDLQETTRQLENQLKEEKAERTAVLELMLQYSTAGISHTDTLEGAVVKAQQWLGIQPDAKVEDLMAKYPTANIKPSDSFADAITKIAQLPTSKESKPPTTFGSASGGYYAWTQDAQGNWIPQQITEGTGGGAGGGTGGTTSPSTYFSPEQLRQINRKGIDINSPEGFQKALKMFDEGDRDEQWILSENYVQKNIDAGATTQQDMALIFKTLVEKNPKLSQPDIKAIMASKGMVQMSGIWVYTGTPELSPRNTGANNVKSSEEKNLLDYLRTPSQWLAEKIVNITKK